MGGDARFSSKKIEGEGVRFSVREDGTEVGRAYLYILHNDLHREPFGLLEDVFVDEEMRGKGLGKRLVHAVIEEAKRQRCYKLIATSRRERPLVHKLYRDLGFREWGSEFRMDFS